METKQKLKERWQTWAWYSVLFDIAEIGVFNRAGFNSISSAQMSNFYEAFIYLGKRADYQNM